MSDESQTSNQEPIKTFEAGLTLYGDVFDEVVLDPADNFESDMLNLLSERASLDREIRDFGRDELKLAIDEELVDDVYSHHFKLARVAACYHRNFSDFEAGQLRDVLKESLEASRKFLEGRHNLKAPLDEIMSRSPEERELFAMVVEGKYSDTQIDFLVTDNVAQTVDAIKAKDEKKERACWIDLFMLEGEPNPKALGELIMDIGRSLKDILGEDDQDGKDNDDPLG